MLINEAFLPLPFPPFILTRATIDFDEMASGLNKRRIIQRAVFDELCKVWGLMCLHVAKGIPCVVDHLSFALACVAHTFLSPSCLVLQCIPILSVFATVCTCSC